MTTESKTDEQLMLDYASGNAVAFEELFRRYGKKIYNLFFRSLNDAGIAEDLLQDCFIRVIEARERYKPESDFSSWIFTIAMNLLRDQYRTKKRRPRAQMAESFDDGRLHNPAKEEEPQQTLERQQVKEAVAKALESLPDEQREVIVLSKYEGLSFAEIGKILNLSPAAAKQKAYRGLQSLNRRLAHLKQE